MDMIEELGRVMFAVSQDQGGLIRSRVEDLLTQFQQFRSSLSHGSCRRGQGKTEWLGTVQVGLNSRGKLNKSSPQRGNRTKMVMKFKAGNHLRFAQALVTISIYANAFAADSQVAPDIASTSGSASGTPTLNLRVQVMPGGTPPLASPSVSPFEQEVTSLDNPRID